MRDFLKSANQKFSGERLFLPALSFGLFTTLVALAMYAYLGTFSRYANDDYCLTAFFMEDGALVSRMIDRYLVSSSRYTNILFIGLVDKLFGWYNVAILPPLMLVLFVLGLYLLLKEIGQLSRWGWSRRMTFFMAGLIAYFSIVQAPNLVQILYWRAGMTSHFAPLVFMFFLGTFLLNWIQHTRGRMPSVWVRVACFLGTFLIGGFSEPPTALMITILFLAICGVWWWGSTQARRSVLTLLSWSLAGALVALLVLAFAPANSLRLKTPPPGLIELVSRIVRFPLEFIMDTFRTLPTPTLMSIVISVVLFYAIYADPSKMLSREARKRLWLLLVLVPLISYLLVAASFAPSAYGQSYPIPRARFAGTVLMTSALMMESALSGILVANMRMKIFQSTHLRNFAILVFLILMLYPLRIALRTSTEIPAHQQRASEWDVRDAQIRELKAQGAENLVVRFLPREQIQDLGDRTTFRLNRCASIIYGVNSIVAIPMEPE